MDFWDIRLVCLICFFTLEKQRGLMPTVGWEWHFCLLLGQYALTSWLSLWTKFKSFSQD